VRAVAQFVLARALREHLGRFEIRAAFAELASDRELRLEAGRIAKRVGDHALCVPHLQRGGAGRRLPRVGQAKSEFTLAVDSAEATAHEHSLDARARFALGVLCEIGDAPGVNGLRLEEAENQRNTGSAEPERSGEEQAPVPKRAS
jgi:hypothetical protein